MWLGVFLDDPLSPPHGLLPVRRILWWQEVESVRQLCGGTERGEKNGVAVRKKTESLTLNCSLIVRPLDRSCSGVLNRVSVCASRTVLAGGLLAFFHQQAGDLGVGWSVSGVIRADYHPDEGGSATGKITLDKSDSRQTDSTSTITIPSNIFIPPKLLFVRSGKRFFFICLQ